jgi:hypothetical protein
MRKLLATGLCAFLFCSGCEEKSKTTEQGAGTQRRMVKPGDQPVQPVPPK